MKSNSVLSMLQAMLLLILFRLMLVPGTFSCSGFGPDWSLFGTKCYKRIGGSFHYSEANQKCLDMGANIIMPKTASEIAIAKHFQSSKVDGVVNQIWFGVTDFNKDGIWTWDDGTIASDNIFGCNDRYGTEDCARLRTDHRLCHIECSNFFTVVCQREADLASTNRQTTESTKPTTGEHTSSTKILTMKKNDCESKSNGCQCQKRMSDTTESVKITDYIWLRKCEVQHLIDSGVFNEIDCPYTCTCSSRDTTETNPVTYEMLTCIKRN